MIGLMKLTGFVVLYVAALSVQTSCSTPTTPKSALIGTSKGIFSVAKSDVLKSMDKIPEDLWSFKPTPEVRTVGQLFAHIADGQYEFCGPVAEGKSVDKSIEKSAQTKADIAPAVKEAFAYCDGAFDKLTDASAVETMKFFNRDMTRIGIMDLNTAHTMEHYGNLVTYMRMKGIVPPSSEAQK